MSKQNLVLSFDELMFAFADNQHGARRVANDAAKSKAPYPRCTVG